jgi:hypothetical protein
MPLIAKEKKEVFKTIPIKFEEGLAERLIAYAEFLESSRDHVVSAAMKYIMDHDRDFVAHMTANGISIVPRKRGRPSNKPAAAEAH